MTSMAEEATRQLQEQKQLLAALEEEGKTRQVTIEDLTRQVGPETVEARQSVGQAGQVVFKLGPRGFGFAV